MKQSVDFSLPFYFATLSSHFTIASMTNIDNKQTTANTLQVIEMEILSYIIAPRNKEKFPTAVAVSQPPCIKPCMCAGATFDTKEIPRGEINNSATVKINKTHYKYFLSFLIQRIQKNYLEYI